MPDEHLTINRFVSHTQQGHYLTVPFTMPADIESLTIRYRYERFSAVASRGPDGDAVARRETAVIDLGLIDACGRQVGASGSNKTEITVSEVDATPGYEPWPLAPGEWSIIVGAYHIPPEGVEVAYELTFTPKHLRWLKGDLHTHTRGSDGVLTVAELAQRALRHGLDFLAVTDHNQMATSAALPRLPGLTLIPGIEWTHFRGHANFLGVDRPYDEPFVAETFDEVRARFTSARERGATITINHPFEPGCAFQFDMDALPWDCLEVWNGPMRECNLRSIALWDSLLKAGRRIPVCAGSDYHRDMLFIFPGGPATCVFTRSHSPADILAALRQGHAYLVYAPDGPALELTAGDVMMGDSVPFAQTRALRYAATGLLAGDVLRVLTQAGCALSRTAEEPGELAGDFVMDTPGYARVEILRSFIPGLPLLPALLSNPVYFVQ